MKKSYGTLQDYKCLFIIFILFTITGSCQKEKYSSDGHLIIQTRSPFGDEQACGQLAVDIYNEFETPIVITKQEEMGSFRSCVEGSNKKIDFNKEFLVAVRVCSACGTLKKQEVTLDHHKLNFTIEIQNSICQAITCANYFILIPKKYIDYPIELSINKYY